MEACGILSLLQAWHFAPLPPLGERNFLPGQGRPSYLGLRCFSASSTGGYFKAEVFQGLGRGVQSLTVLLVQHPLIAHRQIQDVAIESHIILLGSH